MYLRFAIFICVFVVPALLSGQTTNGLIAYYPFDDGTATDQASGNSNGVLSDVAPQLGCGVSGNALSFDGNDNFVSLLGTVSTGDYIRELGAFTISFFFQADSPFGTHDIISKRESCTDENALAIRYTPASRTLSVDLFESSDRAARFSHRVADGFCWIHVAITMDRNNQSLYVNGAFVENKRIDGHIDLSSNALMRIADSPCLGSTDRRFSGLLDELRVYNRPLRDDEVAGLFIATDQITTQDTTINLGTSARLAAGTNCAAMFNWMPAATLSVSDDLITEATPMQSTTYTLEFIYPNCTATDTVRVNVIDPSLVDCNEVPMPNAFSPNGDGKNDQFFISNPFSVQDLKRFEIFDKWGNMVFGTTNVNEAWDGSYLGEMVNPGMFIYKIRYSCGGEELTKSGSLMVLR